MRRAIVVLAALAAITAATDVVYLPVINPSFEFPATATFSTSVTGWQSENGAGIFNAPKTAYAKIPVLPAMLALVMWACSMGWVEAKTQLTAALPCSCQGLLPT